MAAARVPVTFDPNTRKVEAAFARIQAQAKGLNFGAGASSIDKLSRPLGRITGQANEFQKSLEASNARVLAFGASVAVINKLSEAFGALVNNTIKVEATFAKINTILGGTQAQLEQFGNGIFKVAQNTATSFDQVAEGALELARQGLSVEESLSRVETALQLVRVTGIKSTEAVAGLTAAIKGFEGAGLTVAEIADKLSQVDTQFAVSTEDLINGLERASASARVAGVSFDELIGVITTVQERTQRGGAVIGNAFKTIFARLGRTDTLVALQDLGISVLDSEGNVRSAIPLFQELATELDKLGLKSVEAGEVIQKVAGVRQRDILISLVEDLNSGQSQFAKSLDVAANSVGALDSKNESLNQTLEALLNNLTVGGQQLASVLGEIGFTDAASDILKAFSGIVNGITDILQGESVGAKFAQGLVKGVGNILTGPGLALISAIFIKLFVDLAKFGSQSLKQILGINKAAQEQNLLQQSVLQTLLQNENIQREILALEGNKIAQEQLLLKIYNDQAAALARVSKAASTVTPGLFGAGFRGGEKGVGKTGRGAGGYVAAEASDVSRGVGGATAGSKVVSIPNFAFGGGERGTMVANTSEYFVPNYAGGGDAIFNRDMVRSMGLPSGARKLNAAGGFIPNFNLKSFSDYMRSRGISAGKVNPGSTDYSRAYRENTKGYREDFNKLSPLQQRNISKKYQQQVALGREKGATDVSKYGIMYSDAIGGTSATNLRTPGGNNIRAVPVDTQPPNKLYSDLRNAMVKSAQNFAATLGFTPDIIQDNKFKRAADQSLNPGAVESAFGTVFEAAFQGALGIPQKSNAVFDLGTNAAIRSLVDRGKAGGIIERIGGSILDLEAVDLKNALNVENIKSIDNKIASISKRKPKKGGRRKRSALGYIPNFQKSALEESIERERAAGNPINQIRINQDGSLRNAQNPDGLAVTNMRDEPTGRIPNFHNSHSQIQPGRARLNQPGATATKEVAEMGKKAKEAGNAFESSMGKIFALQFAVSGLTGVIGEQEGATGALIDGVNSATTALFALSAINLSPLGAFGKGGALTKSMRGGKGLFAAFKGITGVMGKLRAVAGPVALGFVAVSTAVKAITGKGVFQLLGESFGILANDTQKASQKINEAIKNLRPGKEGEDATSNILEVFDNIAGRNTRQVAGLKSLEGATDEQLRLVDVFRANPILGQLGGGITGTANAATGRIIDGTKVFETEDQFGFNPNPGAINNQLFGNIKFNKQDAKSVQERLQKTLLKNSEEVIAGFEAKTGVTATAEEAQDFLKTQRELVATFFKRITDGQKQDDFGRIAAKDVDLALESLAIGLRTRYGNLVDELNARTEKGIADADPNKVISSLADDIKLARRQGKLARFEGFEVGEGGVTSPTKGPGADTARSLEIQVELSRNLTSLAKERLQAEKNILDFQIKSQDANRDIGASLAENVATLVKGRAVFGDQEEKILELVRSGKSFEDILVEINGLVDQEAKGFSQINDEFNELIKKAQDENRLLEIRNSFEARRLELLKQQAAMSPLERSNQKREQDLNNLTNTLPDKLANNLESSLTTALNDFATGAETNLGTVFGNIALNFGKELQQQLNAAIAKDLVSSITDGGGFQDFFGNIGSIFSKDESKFNKGGLVSGGSGVRDDVPAKLTGGEYVMKKAAVQKYGLEFFDRINSGQVSKMQRGGSADSIISAARSIPMSGGFRVPEQEASSQQGEFFVPGTRGAGQIQGKENLLKFAQQEFTSGATDVIGSTGSGAFINLEDQSTRLTQFGRFRDSPARRALKAAQNQALDLYNARMAEEERARQANKARSERFKGAVIGSFVSAGLQIGVGAAVKSIFQPRLPGQEAGRFGEAGSTTSREAFKTDFDNPNYYGAADFKNKANGGEITSNTNALLMGGEYILSSKAANSLGRQVLDDINNMRTPPMMMANGGAVGSVASSSSAGSSSAGSSSADVGGVNIEINMNDSGSAEVNASTGGGGKQNEAKEFAKKVKEVVVGVIAEEKRVSGSLFTRRK